MKSIKIFTPILIMLIFLGSCTIQRNKLFKIPRGSEFAFDTLPKPPYPDYKIAVDDRITFNVMANNGEKLFLGNGQNSLGTGDFTVRKDGKTYIPLIGDLYLLGLTVNQCEELLTKEFSKYINDPYIKLSISNSRVIVFKGQNSALIIPLVNAKTTLLEVIALSGGMPDRGDARNLKLIRTVKGKREIYRLDLSTVDKLELGEMLVQANDYIFIDERINLPNEVIKEVVPYISLFTLMISSFSIIKIYSK
jgi:polysaccharide export outer membrane protein